MESPAFQAIHSLLESTVDGISITGKAAAKKDCCVIVSKEGFTVTVHGHKLNSVFHVIGERFLIAYATLVL